MNRVCVVFNHPFPSIVDKVRELNSHVGDVTIVAPPGGGGDLEYCAGSYLWQAAVVEFLKNVHSTDEGSTVVVGDDLVLNPMFDLDTALNMAGRSGVLHKGLWPIQGTLPSEWPWHARTALAWARPMHSLLGNGHEDVPRTLTESLYYRANSETIARMPAARLVVKPGLLPADWAEQCIVSEFGPAGACDFGLPLFGGYSDFFTFPNSEAPAIADFLARSVRCNLFVEVAIPTMLMWSGLNINALGPKLLVLWQEERKRLAFTSELELLEFFRSNLDVIGAHPVKVSNFLR